MAVAGMQSTKHDHVLIRNMDLDGLRKARATVTSPLPLAPALRQSAPASAPRAPTYLVSMSKRCLLGRLGLRTGDPGNCRGGSDTEGVLPGFTKTPVAARTWRTIESGRGVCAAVTEQQQCRDGAQEAVRRMGIFGLPGQRIFCG